MYRTPKHEQQYKKYRKKKVAGCQFCEPDPKDVIEEGHYCYVIKNIFPYSLWDHSKVLDHLMLIPKQHTDALHKLNEKDQKEIMAYLSKYEEQGYDIFARSQASNLKTVIHQHTHLIKPDGSLMKRMFYLRKPYVRHFK